MYRLLAIFLCAAVPFIESNLAAASIEYTASWPGFSAYSPVDSYPTESAIYVLSWSTLAVVAPTEGGHHVSRVMSLGMNGCTRLYPFGSDRILAASGSGFVLLDIADRLNPGIAGAYHSVGGWFLGTIGSIVYFNNVSAHVIDVVDCSVPVAPVSIGTIPGNLTGAIRETMAYGTTDAGEFQIWNIIDQTNRMVLGALNGQFSARRAYLSGSSAYLLPTSLGAGIDVIDISQPAGPKAAGRIVTGGDVYDMAIDGDTGWITDGKRGLVKANLRDLASQTETIAPLALLPESMKLFQRSLHIVDETDWALQIFSITNGTARTQERVPLSQPTESISLSGQIAVASGGASLALVDVSVPKRLRELSRIDLGTHVGPHARNGDFVFVNAGPGLGVIDVSDSLHPRLISQNAPTETAIFWNTVITGENTLYVGTFEGLVVIDVSNPEKPLTIATNQIGPVISLHRNGNYLYASALNREPAVFDITDRLHPSFIRNLDLHGTATAAWYGFAQEGSLLVISANYISGNSSADLLFLNAADAASPRFVGWGPEAKVLVEMKLRVGTLYYLSSARIRAYDLSGITLDSQEEPRAIDAPLIAEGDDFDKNFLGLALTRGSILLPEGSTGVSTWSAHLLPKIRSGL
ncbi:MAG: hypothetical protein JWM99_3025, partial [Verrucomicrobiales bacterium]|nr:hypothetical protein [Verrucomicrobiales bacterium]